MVKRNNHTKRRHRSERMLPIDSRLFPDIISFTHVRGVARVFLALEMICAVGVVLGTLSLVIIHTLYR